MRGGAGPRGLPTAQFSTAPSLQARPSDCKAHPVGAAAVYPSPWLLPQPGPPYLTWPLTSAHQVSSLPPLSISSPSSTFQLKQKLLGLLRAYPAVQQSAPAPPLNATARCFLGPVPRTSLSCLLGSRTGHMQAPAGYPVTWCPQHPQGLAGTSLLPRNRPNPG